MVDLSFFYMSLTLGIVVLRLSFGIVNTMSMSLIERMKEFGVMRALGTTPARLEGLIMTEAAFLGVVGCVLGLSLGLGLHFAISRTGISFGKVEAMGVSFENPVYPVLNPLGIGGFTLVFLVLTPLVAVVVARRAGRIKPAEALRRE
jgi:ABC-type antimicrobial peptide transport system permease subunit